MTRSAAATSGPSNRSPPPTPTPTNYEHRTESLEAAIARLAKFRDVNPGSVDYTQRGDVHQFIFCTEYGIEIYVISPA